MAIDPLRFLNEQKASDMLDRNIPMETIIKETGIPRERVTAMLQSQGLDSNFQQSNVPATINAGRQLSQTMPSGISSVPMNEEMGALVGKDVADYLVEDIGADPANPGEILPVLDKRQETGQIDSIQMLASGNEKDVKNIIKTKGEILASDPTDFDMDQIYAAAELLQGKLKYNEDIPKPSEGLPWLMLASKLIKSGAEGDDWSTALSESALAYFTAKKSGELNYKKELRAEDRQKYSDYNNLVMQFGMLDFKNKAAINKALRDQSLKAPKMYDISNTGDFTDKSTVPLSDSAFSMYAKAFPENIRPAKNADVQAMSVYTKDGGILHSMMDQDAINAWNPARQGGATLRQGHKDPTNLKLYSIKSKDGVQQDDDWLTPDQFRAKKELGFDLTIIPGGAPKFVINKSTGEQELVTMEQLIANPDAYRDDGGFNFVMGADGEVAFSSGSAGMQRLLKGKGIKAYDELVGVADATQQAVFNYFSSAAEQDKILKEFLEANPNAKDLPFNNFAGTATRFVDSLRINFEAFSNVLGGDAKNGGATFYIGDEKVTKEALFTNFTNSEGYAEFRESPLAKFFEDNGVVGDALDAALFDLALVGASTYSPNKGGLDLRAISDRDMLSFIKLQGGEARTLNAFIDISNRFRRNLINRNRNALKQLIKPTNLIRITDANDQPDETRIEALKGNVAKTLSELDEYETKYQTSYTYGLGNPGELITPNTFVADKSVDEDNDNVIAYNPRIAMDSQTGQQFGFTKDYDLQTQTEIEGTFRNILNTYTSLQSKPAELTAYFDNLKNNLTPEEFIAFQIFLQKAPQTGN
jgi:hypothetical protein